MSNPGLIHHPTPTVCCVIVTFKPDPTMLRQVLQAVTPQVHKVIIAHNGINADFFADMVTDFHEIIVLGDNLGIGAAQNAGIKAAKLRGFSHVLLLDQDSVPAPQMVQHLMNALIHLEHQKLKPGVVAPRIVDARSGMNYPFVSLNLFTTEKRHCQHASTPEYIPANFLIASGMLIPMTVFDRVGLMNESFFIDNVDVEWCFRVGGKGYFLYGICSAILTHTLGDRVIRLWFGKEIAVSIYRHASLRQYYIMRNSILLYLMHYTPGQWIFRDFIRLLLKTVLRLAFSDNKAEYLKMIFKGLIDGLRGKSGKYPT